MCGKIEIVKNKGKKKKREKPVSLYPLEPEEALKDLMQISPKPIKKKKIAIAKKE